MKTFAGPENARSNYVKYGINSVWLSVYDDPELKAAHAHQWPTMVADFARAKNPPLSGESQDFLTNTLQDMANGRTTPADGSFVTGSVVTVDGGALAQIFRVGDWHDERCAACLPHEASA